MERYSECADATALHAMLPCIERELAGAQTVNAGSALREKYPGLAAAVFVPLTYVPLPRCGVKLHGGIWQSIAELTDAVVAAVYASPTLRSRVLLLPSDVADLPNVPTVSGVDLLTGRAYAYGAVADLLEAVAAGAPEALGGRRAKQGAKRGAKKEVSTKAYLKQARGGHTCLLTHINQCVEAVARQRGTWEARHTGNAFGLWRASGCGDGSTLPYDLHGYDRAILTEPIPAEKFRGGMNLAAMRALYCSDISSLVSVALLQNLKLVTGAAVARSLIEPWAVAGFAAATDADNNLGSLQLLSVLLRSANNTVVLSALDRVLRQAKVTDQVAFAAGVRPNETDVVRAAVCAFVPTEAVPQPPAPVLTGPTAATIPSYKRGELVAHAYNPDAAGIDLWNLARESPAAAKTGVAEVTTTAEPRGMWFTIGTRPGYDCTCPYFKTGHTQHAGTVFQLLPAYTQADDQALSVFFAGTRYMDFDDRFGDIRTALGRAVSICAPTPTLAEVWLLVSNFPTFMHSRLKFTYYLLEHIAAMKAAMTALDVTLYNLDAQMLAAKVSGVAAQQPMTDAEYDTMGSMPAAEVLEFLERRNQAKYTGGPDAAPSAEVRWIVYGRSDALELKRLYPAQAAGVCPFSVRAVELLRSRQLPFTVHQVLDAADRAIPSAKPPGFVTVPVVFKQTPKGLEFVGGFDALTAELNKT